MEIWGGKVQQKLFFGRAVIVGTWVLACLFFPNLVQGKLLNTLDEMEKVIPGSEEIGHCFVEKVKGLRPDIDEQGKDTRRLEIFFASAVIALKKEIEVEDGEGKLKRTEVICEKIFQEYNKRFQPAFKQLKQEAKNSLAPMTSDRIEIHSTFVKVGREIDSWFNDWFNEENWGHSDITREALEELQSEYPMTEQVREIIIRYSEEADLYFWKSDPVHAHSPPPKDISEPEKKSAARIGQCQFKKVIYSCLSDTWQAAHNLDFKIRYFALRDIGLGLHSIQDLVYHRGMTLGEHSALQFLHNQNPDKSEGYVSNDPRGQAKKYSKQFLRKTIKMIGNDLWADISTWPYDSDSEIKVKLNIRNLPLIVGSQDFNGWTATNYFLEDIQFLPGGKYSKQFTVDPETQKVTGGYIQWDVPKIMQEILAKIPEASESLDGNDPFEKEKEINCKAELP